MENQAVSERTSVKGFPPVVVQPIKCDERMMIDLKVKFDPKTGKTTPDESQKIDLVELIQTYKDQCGMELAKKLIRTGQVPPDAFKDDGKHSYDASIIPETAQARDNAANAQKAQVDAMASALGIPADYGKLTDDQLTTFIKEYISRNESKFVKPATAVEESK